MNPSMTHAQGESTSAHCDDKNQIPLPTGSSSSKEEEQSLEALSSTLVDGIVANNKSGIIEGKLLQREDLVPFGIAKLLPSLLKPWRERFAVLDIQRFQMRVWHSVHAYHSDADPIEEVNFTSCMSLSTVKANSYDGRRILYRFVANVPTTQRLSPRSEGSSVGRSTRTEAADIVSESAKVFRFGADSQAAFEIWSVGIRKAIEAAEKWQLQIDDERSAFENGSRLNTSSLLQRALSSPSLSLTSQERITGFRASTTSEMRRHNTLPSSTISSTSSITPSISQTRDNFDENSSSQSSVTTFSSTASHIASAFGAIYSQSASSVSLCIHFLDNSRISLPPLPISSIARDVCVVVSRLIGLKADADFSLFLRQSGDESSSGFAVFTCVPDLLSLQSLDGEMEKCRGTLVFKRRIYVPQNAIPIPGLDSHVHSRSGGSDSGETSRFQSQGDGEPEPLARDSREVQTRRKMSHFSSYHPVPLSINSRDSPQPETSEIHAEMFEAPLHVLPLLQEQSHDAVDAEVDNALSPLEGALRLAYAEAIYNVREGLYLLPLKDCLSLAGLQLVCEKNLVGEKQHHSEKNGSCNIGAADARTTTTTTVTENSTDERFDGSENISLLPPPPLEWYVDRISDLLPAYAVLELTSIIRDRQSNKAEDSRVSVLRNTSHSSPLLTAIAGRINERAYIAHELRQMHQSVTTKVARSVLSAQKNEIQTRITESEPCESAPVRQQQRILQKTHIRVMELMILFAQNCYIQRIRKLSEYGASSFFVGELTREITSPSVGSGSRGATPTPIWASSIDRSRSSTSAQKSIKVLVTLTHLGIFLRPLPPRHGPMLSSSSDSFQGDHASSSHERDDPYIIQGDPSYVDHQSRTPWSWQIHSVQLIEVWGVKKTRPGFVYRVREKKLVNVEISTSAFKEIAGTLHSIVFALMNQREGRPRLVVRDVEDVSRSTTQRAITTSTTRGRQLAQAALAAARDARDTAQASLPHGWSEIVDPSTGQTAWWNVETRATVFSRPVV